MNSGTEQLLRQTLKSVAEAVETSPEAFSRAAADWRRRERRRRFAVACIASVVIAVANILSLWALNRASGTGEVIYDLPVPAPTRTVEIAPLPLVRTGLPAVPSSTVPGIRAER